MGTAPRSSETLKGSQAADANMRLTEEQRAALELRDVSVALSAGAGCGKTHVLTSRLLAQLEPAGGCTLDDVVAITFTERAAREMRDRIRRECRRRLGGAAPSDAEHWIAILRQLETAAVSTIHSYCQRVLRAHAVEARLDPRFGVLDETASATLLRNAVEGCLHRLLARRDADLMELVLRFGLTNVARRVMALVRARHKIDFDAWVGMPPEELVARWQRVFDERVVPEALEQFAAGFDASELAGILHAHRPSHETMRARCQWLLKHVSTLPKHPEPLALLGDIRNQAKVQGGGGARVWPDTDLYETVKNGLKALRDEIDALCKLADPHLDRAHQGAAYGLAFLRVTRSAVDAYERAKDDAAALDFDDLLIRARDLLCNNEDLRKQLSRRIRLLLVDELQDTDSLQVDLVRMLCGKLLRGGKLFIVGDYKQSIYRFRSANPEVFRALRDDLPKKGRRALTENFRSQPAILEFVNALFDGAMREKYEPLRSHFQQLGPTPAVEVILAPAVEEKETAEVLRRREARAIAERLDTMVRGGERHVVERNREAGTETLRPVRWGDVALLFQALSDVRYYEEALRARDIPTYLVGGHAFFAQQEIYDLANLLGAVENSGDAVRLAGALRSAFFSLEDETLFWISGEDHDLARGLFDLKRRKYLRPEQRRRVEFAADVLEHLRAIKDRVPIAALVAEALDRTGYDAALLVEFLGRRQLANLYKLTELARQLDRSGLFTLADFVEDLEQFVAEQPREPQAALHPEHGDVVRLMTIHQAKGLEFPVVFIPDVNRPRQNQLADALFDPELGPLVRLPAAAGQSTDHLGRDVFRSREAEADEEEALRLLYVATTRAADHLVLSTALKETGDDALLRSKSPWMRLLAERFDLTTGECRVELPKNAVAPCLKITVSQPDDEPPAKWASSHGDLRELADRLRKQSPDGEPLDAIAAVPVCRAQRRGFSISQFESVESAGVGPTGERVRCDVEDFFPSDVVDDAAVRGSVVHAVLERIDFHEPGDLEALVRQCLAEHNPAGQDQDTSGLGALIGRFLESETARSLRSAEPCYRELEFLLRWPPEGRGPFERYLRGFIDCLYRDDAGWHLLDFKTNRITADQAESTAAEYTLQLAVYALAAEQLVKEPLESVGLYFLEPALRWNLAFTPRVRQRAIEQVSEAISALVGR